MVNHVDVGKSGWTAEGVINRLPKVLLRDEHLSSQHSSFLFSFLSPPSKCLNFILLLEIFCNGLVRLPFAAALREAGSCWEGEEAAAHEYAQRILFGEAKHDARSHSWVTHIGSP